MNENQHLPQVFQAPAVVCGKEGEQCWCDQRAVCEGEGVEGVGARANERGEMSTSEVASAPKDLQTAQRPPAFIERASTGLLSS